MSSTALLSMLCWSFLPDLVTGYVQTFYYGITIRAGDPKPQPGSQIYIRHNRRIRLLVVSSFLLYTIYEADWEMRRAGDYYQDLGVPHDIDNQGIKSRFRRLAALYHPDKLTSQTASSENHFVHLKLAQDTLMDPVKRFAYDRFGPGITQWRHCSSIRDYVLHGLQTSTLPLYGVTAVSIYLLGMTGYLQWGTYWRWFTLIALCVFELHAISRPCFPVLATKLINPVISTYFNHPPYLPFQLITLSRRMAFTMFIAFSQIGPLLQSPEAQRLQANPEVALKQSLQRLAESATAVEIDAVAMMDYEMSPYRADRQVLRDLIAKTRDWLVRDRIHGDPEVIDAMGRVVPRRRADVPSGARGNR